MTYGYIICFLVLNIFVIFNSEQSFKITMLTILKGILSTKMLVTKQAWNFARIVQKRSKIVKA